MNLRLLLVAVGLLVLLVRPVDVMAQPSIAVARQLYASAEYKDALSMLDNLLTSNPAPQDRQTIDLYRTFCLVAWMMIQRHERMTLMNSRSSMPLSLHPSAREVRPSRQGRRHAPASLASRVH